MSFRMFLVFVVALITLTSIGLTSYYFMRDTETIFVKTRQINVNVNEEFSIDIERTEPNKKTKFSYIIRDKEIVSYNSTDNTFKALKEGKTEILVDTNKSGWDKVKCILNVGGGSDEFPYIIKNTSDLQQMGGGVWSSEKHYILTCDIDLTGINWAPLFTSGFIGTFDGNGHTISNMTINGATGMVNAGLFAKIGEGGIVKNLKFNKANISGEFENAGIVAGESSGIVELITIDDSEINGGVDAVSNIGGVVGKLLTASDVMRLAKVDRVAINKLNFIGKNDNIGGLVGSSVGGEITHSYVMGNFTTTDAGETSKIGGLVSHNTNNGSIKANLAQCYAVPTFNVVDSTLKSGLIYNNINKDAQPASANLFWGLYADTTVSGLTSDFGIGKLSDACKNVGMVPTADLKNRDKLTLVGVDEKRGQFNFTTIWDLSADLNSGYPILRMGAGEDVGFESVKNPEGSIYTPTDLVNQINDMYKNYTLAGDIDFLGVEWTPIGTRDNPYMGTFDGNGYTIKNFKITQYVTTEENNAAGFFGFIGSSAIIKNLTLENVEITVGENIGVFVGSGSGKILNCKLTGSNNINVTTSKAVNVGGIAGYYSGEIVDCQSKIKANVGVSTNKVANVGGVVGYNAGIVENTTANATLETNAIQSYVGGVAGFNEKSVNYSSANVDLKTAIDQDLNYAGGVVGANVANATTTKSSASGAIYGYKVAGVCGYNYGDISESYVDSTTITGILVGGLVSDMDRGHMENCYAIATLNGIENKGAEKGGIAGACRGSTDWRGNGSFAVIEHCFVAITFDNNGKNYAETPSTIRSSIAGTDSGKNAGIIVESVYNDSIDGNAAKQMGSYISLFDQGGNNGYYYGANRNNLDGRFSTVACQEKSTFTGRGFNDSVWNFVDGSYPTLNNAKN